MKLPHRVKQGLEMGVVVWGQRVSTGAIGTRDSNCCNFAG